MFLKYPIKVQCLFIVNYRETEVVCGGGGGDGKTEVVARDGVCYRALVLSYSSICFFFGIFLLSLYSIIFSLQLYFIIFLL